MHLQRADGGDQHHGVGLEPGHAALDVEELLGAEVGAEAGFRHHIIGELERRGGGEHRVAAMRDIGEGAAMDEGGRALQRLHQVGRQRVLQQRGHRPVALELTGAHRFAVAGIADNDIGQALLEIVDVLGQAEHRHHLGGDRDVETVLAREAVGDAAERGDDRAQRTVVHVDGAAPGDAAAVEPERIAPVDVVVDQRAKQVVGGGDGVEIAGEVQIDVLHRHHLGIAAAGGTALDAEAGPERGLAQAQHRLLADLVERVGEADRGGGLALAGRRRCDGRHQDQLAVGLILQRLNVVHRDLGLEMAVGLEIFRGDAELFLGKLHDRPRLGGLGNFDVGLRGLMLRGGHGDIQFAGGL